MKNMTLLNIAKACNGTLYNNDFDGVVSGVVIDSRLVMKNYLFIASKGEKVDGHDYIESAFRNGARAVVCEKAPMNTNNPYILVKDSLLALKEIARWYRMQLNIPIIGITGSVGKTSTKEFVSSVLSQRFEVLKTEGNFNNEIGLPLTILKIRKEHQIAVVEMGINHFGEMHNLSEIAKPDYCLFTNIGQSHLENLGSREGILKAKSEIFDFMNEDGRVILNGDDDMLSTIQKVKGKSPIRYGLGPNNDIYGDNITSKGLWGSSLDIHINNKVLHVDVPMAGTHMILNALAAASVGSMLGLTDSEIIEGIKQNKPLKGRNNIINHERCIIIDDCYNANPVSMKAAIDLLDKADTRKVAILGDMGELGETENSLHKEIGMYAASKDLDVIIFVGKLSYHMYEGATDRFKDAREYPTLDSSSNNAPISERLYYFDNMDSLMSSLTTIVKDGDTILVKASHFMGFDKIVNKLLQ
ncbi:MAG: UDP-N-acetylmuramoyl-tripeptide--D-alanyl-D-alanine ligase [Clostridiales bacterium]|nr:UDP-N-acetylmuramoyl-tripeptide--D-alanyl-D-alanine ligase [Clostridiales bacterium]